MSNMSYISSSHVSTVESSNVGHGLDCVSYYGKEAITIKYDAKGNLTVILPESIGESSYWIKSEIEGICMVFQGDEVQQDNTAIGTCKTNALTITYTL